MRQTAMILAGAAGLMAGQIALGDATQNMAKYVLSTSDGFRQEFRLFVPENYDPGRSYPVIIYLSGSGENGTDNTSQLAHINPIINHVKQDDAFSAFVIAPQARPNTGGFQSFLPGRAIPMTMEALDLLGKEFNLDSNRIYLTGLSQGGIGTWETAAHYQGKFAAIAPVAGHQNAALIPKLVDTPTWAFHGGSDFTPTVQVTGTRAMIRDLQGAGARPLYTEYYGMGHADQTWAKVYNEHALYEWMFNQTLNGPITTPPPLPPANPNRSFSDQFSGTTLHAQLEDVGGNYLVADGLLKHTSANGSRTYVRTTQADLNTQSFIFAVTVNLQAAGGNGIAFVGYGPGDPVAGSFDEPTTSAMVRLAPPDFAGGSATLNVLGQQIASFDTYGGGRHRVQLIKEGNQLTINLDRDYNGEIFFIDHTHTIDLTTLDSFDDLNSHLFFGTASHLTSFDDVMLHVVALPEPMAGLLIIPAAVLLGRRRTLA